MLRFQTNIKSSAVITAAVMLLTGCTTSRGPGLVHKQSYAYNEKIRHSLNEQLLLNLVRLRYNDIPLFLQLSTVVTQYAVQNNTDLGTTLNLTHASGAKAAMETTPSVGLSAAFEERPTVTYTPLQGKDFAERILSPVLPETIVLLSRSGWSISRLLSLCVQGINGVKNAETASGPTPAVKPEFETFTELVQALRRLQQAGFFHVSSGSEEERGRTRIIFRDPEGNMPELKEDLARVRRILDLPEDRMEFSVSRMPYRKTDEEMAFSTRSLLGILFFLSHAVKAPPDHRERNLVAQTRDRNGNVFDWSALLNPLMKIRSSEELPGNAFVRIFYRGYWYYIDDSDLNSKSTFGLLNYLFALQSAEGKGGSPLLTISTGA